MTGRDARRRTWTNLRKSLIDISSIPSHPKQAPPEPETTENPGETERRFDDLFLNCRKVEICAGVPKHNRLPIDETHHEIW